MWLSHCLNILLYGLSCNSFNTFNDYAIHRSMSVFVRSCLIIKLSYYLPMPVCFSEPFVVTVIEVSWKETLCLHNTELLSHAWLQVQLLIRWMRTSCNTSS